MLSNAGTVVSGGPGNGRFGLFQWSLKRKIWFVPVVPEDWSELSSSRQFTTKQKALKHVINKLPETGPWVFALSMLSRRKKGWSVLGEWAWENTMEKGAKNV
jgi:hypothetical protein